MAGEADDLTEKDRIATVVTRLFVATDERTWPAVRGCFDASALFDMTSLAGGEPSTLTPEQITEGWEVGLRPIAAIHHQIGNLAIECSGPKASASCYGIAYHYRPTRSRRNTRVFVGSYDLQLRRNAEGAWLITTFRFKLKFIEGNRELENEPGP